MTNDDGRTEDRANVFLGAVLHSGASSIAVRIRNISPNGALIDGPDLPPTGRDVSLARGQLRANGLIAWRANDLAGIRFCDQIEIERWIHPGHGGQQRVDKIVAALKRSENVPEKLAKPQEEESLRTISTALDHICERLATMPEMSRELSEDLIRLDAIAHALRGILTKRSV
jgi:hypothetical protein